MKKLQAVVACGIALAMLSATNIFAAEAGQTHAVVRAVHGTAEYSVGANWMPLRPNMDLAPGTQIRTGPDSSVSLNVNGVTSSVRLTENSTMTLDRMSSMGGASDNDTDTSLKLDTGTVLGTVRKLSANSRYEVVTPNGVAGIRGTDFAVTVVVKGDGTYTITFSSITGTVVASGVVGSETVVKVLNAGQSWTIGQDVTPTPAQILQYQQSIITAISAYENGVGPFNLPPPPFAQPFQGNGASQTGNGSGTAQSPTQPN
jgi:hypothetical protein